MPLKLNYLVIDTIMTESDTERALRYPNSAEHIRIMAGLVKNCGEHDTLRRLAAEFDSLAEDIELKGKPR
jgi:hypothetical protein